MSTPAPPSTIETVEAMITTMSSHQSHNTQALLQTNSSAARTALADLLCTTVVSQRFPPRWPKDGWAAAW
jgi:hypothetical protein